MNDECGQEGRPDRPPQLKEEIMHRRSMLKTILSVTAGAGLVANASGPMPTSTRASLPSFIETHDRVGLFYKEWGEGKPVIFVHGWALNSDMWQYQMIHLAAQGLRCIGYDQRGHGRSADPGRGYDFNTLSDDLHSLIEGLNVRKAVLVAHSMGAGVITRYLTRHGASRSARVAMLAPTTPFLLNTTDNPDGVDQRYFERLRAAWSKDFPKWLADNARPFFTSETSAEMIQWGVQMCLQASLKAVLDCNRAITETDFRAELRKLAVPTLIIHGNADASAPLSLTGQKTAQLIPGGQLKIYEGAPHGLFITHQDRVNRDLAEFIKAD